MTKYAGLAAAAGLDWPAVQAMDEAALERRLLVGPRRAHDYVQPNYGRVHQELRRKGMTLMLLWEEHRADYADSQTHAYSQFCDNYRRFAKQLKRSMRQIHRAGEKLFIDYAGPTIALTDGGRAHIFVASLGASSYTYACATPRETMADWLESTARALAFYGGVTQLIVPDNPRAMISDANRYEPRSNDTVLDFARHYSTSILPPGHITPRIRRKPNRRCRSSSAGSWRDCVTSSSAACMKSMKRWRRCLLDLTKSRSRNYLAAVPAPSRKSMHRPCFHCRCSATRWRTSRR